MEPENPMTARARIRIFDTTLRDGEQAPGFSMTPTEKVRMAEQLEALGADIIEAGFPISSEGDFEAVKAVAAAIKTSSVAGLARAVPGDIDRAWEALAGAARPRIHVFLATSDLHLEHKLRIDRTACLARVRQSVGYARRRTPDIEFSAEDATRSDLDFLCEVAEVAVEAGATTVNLPDTVGYALPGEITRLFSRVRARVGDAITLSAHCHNDLGLAVANSLAAVEAGARQVECTINGIGERAGNASLEEVVMALNVRREALPFDTGIVTTRLVPTSEALAATVGIGVAPNKAIVGANAFAHESGIHQDGMLKHALTYEIMRPESVGAAGTKLVLGKHSGMRGLDARCRALGHRLDETELERVYRQVTALADRIKTVSDEQLASIIREEVGRQGLGTGSRVNVGGQVQGAAWR
jgi:2-isopropylmalate synthase